MPLELITPSASRLVTDDLFMLRFPGIYQVSGPPKVGKTTLVLWLAGRIASKLDIPVFVYDTENQDPEALYSIAVGGSAKDLPLYYIKAPENDSEGIDTLLEESKKRAGKTGFVLVFDSLAGVLPPREANQSVGAANMGARAALISSMLKRFMRLPTIVLATNHEYPTFGGYGKSTPGGEAQRYYTQARFSMSVAYNPKTIQKTTIVSGWARWGEDTDRATWLLEIDTVFNRYPNQIKATYPLVVMRGGEGVDATATKFIALIRSGILGIKNGIVYDSGENALGHLSRILQDREYVDSLVSRFYKT